MDVTLYREALGRWLDRDPRFDVIWSVATCDDGLRAALDDPPAVLIVDTALAGAVVAPSTPQPSLRIVSVGIEAGDSPVVPVCGVVGPDSSLDAFAHMIQRVGHDDAERVLSSDPPADASDHRDVLTNREHEIVALIDDGLSNREIANHLLIEVATVKNHVHNLLQKLELHRRGQAAAWLRQLER